LRSTLKASARARGGVQKPFQKSSLIEVARCARLSSRASTRRNSASRLACSPMKDKLSREWLVCP